MSGMGWSHTCSTPASPPVGPAHNPTVSVASPSAASSPPRPGPTCSSGCQHRACSRRAATTAVRSCCPATCVRPGSSSRQQVQAVVPHPQWCTGLSSRLTRPPTCCPRYAPTAGVLRGVGAWMAKPPSCSKHCSKQPCRPATNPCVYDGCCCLQDWEQEYHCSSMRTFLAVPIVAHSSEPMLGVLTLASCQPDAFWESW